MSSIFISHSSQDNWFAEKLKEQLELKGHQSVFLDFDPEQGIPVGSNWEQILYAKLRACQAVIVLCSLNSMQSQWVFAEITHARSQGKQIFPVQIAEGEPISILKDTQIITCITLPDTEPDLRRLLEAIEAANLDSEFAWDVSRDPYPGLTAFEEADAAVFFGRKAEIQEGIEQLNSLRQNSDHRFVLYLGASGSGKSSLIRAGIIPRLKRDIERWLVIDPFRPNEGLANPMDNLVTVLQKAFADRDKKTPISESEIKKDLLVSENGEVHGLLKLARKLAVSRDKREATILIAIDQFEELLISNSIANDNEEEQKRERKPQREFLAWIKEALVASQKLSSCPVMFVATMRSDFLTEYQQCEELCPVSTRQISVMPISKANFGELIEAPAQKAGIELESGLVPQILEDIGTENTLPLLAYTLEQFLKKSKKIWKKQEAKHKILKIEEYKNLEGVKGSIAKKANEILQDNNLDRQEVEEYVKRAFLKLVRINQEGKYIRQRVKESSLPKEALPFLNKLVKNRLLFKDTEFIDSDRESQESIYEVTHEAVFSAWDKLEEWLEGNREFLIWRRRFDESYKIYIESECNEDSLLKGTSLSQALRWQSYLDDKDKDEKEFILLSRNKDINRKRLTGFLRILIPSLFVGILFSIFYLWQNSINIEIIRLIDASEKRQNRLLLEPVIDAMNAAKKLKWAFFLDDRNKLRTENTLFQALLSVREKNRLENEHESDVNAIAHSSEGKLIVTGGSDSKINIWNTEGKHLKLIDKKSNKFFHSNEVSDLTFTPDNQSFASTSFDGTVKMWSREGKLLDDIPAHSGLHIFGVAFNPKYNNLMATASNNVKLWELRNNEWINWKVIDDHKAQVQDIAYNSNGDILATASFDSSVKLWNSKGDFLENLPHDNKVYGVSFDPLKPSILITAGSNGRVRFWNINGDELNSFNAHDVTITEVKFSPDGKYIATSSWDGTLKLWSRQGKLLQTFVGARGVIKSFDFSHDIKTITSTNEDGSAQIWNITKSKRLKLDNNREIKSISFSPNTNNYILTGSWEHYTRQKDNERVKLWKIENNLLEQLDSFSGNDYGVRRIDFHPSGNLVGTVGNDGIVRLWSFEDQNLFSFKDLSNHLDIDSKEFSNNVESIHFSSDGEKFITSGLDGKVILWNTEGEKLQNMNMSDGVWDVRFSYDNQTIAIAQKKGVVKLWHQDLHTDFYSESKELTDPQKPHKGEIYSIDFSNDNQFIVTGSDDNTAKIWSRDGQLITTLKEKNQTKTHNRAITSVSISPDSQFIVTGSDDSTAKIWSRDGTHIRTLDAHKAPIKSVQYSYDGQFIATGSNDRTAVLWNSDLSQTNLDELISKSCDLIHDYLENNDNVSQTDKKMCN